MYRVLACIAEQHNLWMVLLAAAICVLTAAGTFQVLDRARGASPNRAPGWRLLAGVLVGGGAWATHFISMLAYDPGLPVGFDLPLTMLSAAVGIGGAWAAFAVMARAPARWALLAGAGLLASAIGALHYVGMAGLSVTGLRGWDVQLIAASVGLCAAFFFAALAVFEQARGRWAEFASPLLMVLAIVALHFGGMGALTLTPLAGVAEPQGMIDRASLTAMVALGASGLLMTVFIVAIADRRIAAMKLAETARFRRLADAATEGILIHDRVTVIDSNQQFADLMALDSAALIGREVASLFSAQLQEEVNRSLDKTGVSLIERTLQRPGGAVAVEIHTRALNKQENLWISSVRDVTLRRRAEAAESANAQKSMFVANMSHELRTPLNAIIGYSEMLTEEGEDRGDDVIVKDARKINTQAKHLLSLINEILDLSKIEAGKLEISIEPVDLRALVREVTDTVTPMLETNANKLLVQVAPDIAFVRADSFRLKQCLINLMSNAAKFTKEGRVGLRIRRDPRGMIELTVADTGIGMSPEQAAQLFQPFQQADASISRKFGGTGLGLTITKRLMELMGGDVRVRSVEGKGSSFILRLAEAHVAEQNAA